MKTCFAAMLLVASAAPAAWAQFEDDRPVELTRKAIQNERQAILTANLELTEEQAAAFWPLHDAYRADLEGANLEDFIKSRDKNNLEEAFDEYRKIAAGNFFIANCSINKLLTPVIGISKICRILRKSMIV